MAKEIMVEISIDGKRINHFFTITINQQFNCHNAFKLILPHDAVEQLGNYSMQASQKFY